VSILTDLNEAFGIAGLTQIFLLFLSFVFDYRGGCPDALGGCPDGVPDSCDEYRVDLGAHWELKDTEQGTLYGVSDSVAANRQGATGTGDDPIANKDDEYAVSPYCRFDDDDADADNEWAGAWAHTNPVEGEFGSYHFEMSRRLKTASIKSDAQLAAGETIQFGVAFWDPYETDGGWTDIGHFVTGCATKWIDLELVAADAGGSDTSSSGSDTGTTAAEASGGMLQGIRTWLVAVQALVILVGVL